MTLAMSKALKESSKEGIWIFSPCPCVRCCGDRSLIGSARQNRSILSRNQQCLQLPQEREWCRISVVVFDGEMGVKTRKTIALEIGSHGSILLACSWPRRIRTSRTHSD